MTTDAEKTERLLKAAQELWKLEQAHPDIDFSALHTASEAAADALLETNPGVVKPAGGGPK